MKAIFRRRSVTEIIASRKDVRGQRVDCRSTAVIAEEQEEEGNLKLQNLLRKTSYCNEDKQDLIRIIQKKYRIYFGPHYNLAQAKWIVVGERTVVDRLFDYKRKSYYVLKGKITLSERNTNHKESFYKQTELNSQDQSRGNPDLYIESGNGIGRLFSETPYHKFQIASEQSVLMELPHPDGQYDLIEKNCLLTTQERENILKQFNLFAGIDNLNKIYLPFFQLLRYSKNDMIYEIGSQPQYFYLIVEGQIQFESRISWSTPDERCLSELIRKNGRQQTAMIVTEVLSTFNYFGEQQILIDARRRQNARCLSLNCLLLAVPLDKIIKLLSNKDFQKTLQISASVKSSERQRKLQTIIDLKYAQIAQKEEPKHPNLNFDRFNQTLYKSLTEKKQEYTTKISLPDNSSKIIHGNSMSKKTSVTEINPEKFSMLDVNRSMYDQTLKRFRYSLQQLRKKKVPKERVELNRGRSLHKIWKVLKLEDVFHQEEKNKLTDYQEGMRYYDAHTRKSKHLKDTKGYRPKAVGSNCRIKLEYVEYLQNIL